MDSQACVDGSNCDPPRDTRERTITHLSSQPPEENCQVQLIQWPTEQGDEQQNPQYMQKQTSSLNTGFIFKSGK